MPTDSPLAVPGVVHVDKSSGTVTTGPSAGWISPQGIREWSQELSLIARRDLTDAIRESLGVTLPENRIAKSRHPHAHRAAESSPLIGVISDIAPKLQEKGVRVHTVGYDRVTGGFVYFAEGGGQDPVRVHGDLLEMIAPALEGGSSNADIERYLDRFIDRVLQHFSKGLLTESAVELANALPRLATDARGLQGVDLDAFEAEAAANADAAKKHEEGARKLADTLAKANGGGTQQVPLFGEARALTQPAMEIVLEGKSVSLPARTLWTVTGTPEEAKPVEKPKPVEAKPEPKIEKAASPKPAPVATPAASKPVATTPSPSPASAKPKAERLPTPAPRLATPAPGKIPAVLGAKPAEVKPQPAAEKAPISVPRGESPKPAQVASPKPAVVEAVKPAPVISVGGIGEAPAPVSAPPPQQAKLEVVPEPVAAKPGTAIGLGIPSLESKPHIEPPAEPVEQLSKTKQKEERRRQEEAERKAAEKAAPKPEKAERKAEAKLEKNPEPEKKKALSEKPPEPPKSNSMVFVILAILVIAAIAFFLMKKK